MRRCKDTQRDGDCDGEGDRQQRQRQRDRQPFKDQAGNRHAIGIGLAEIAAEYADQPLAIAPKERLIESKLVTEGCERFR